MPVIWGEEQEVEVLVNTTGRRIRGRGFGRISGAMQEDREGLRVRLNYTFHLG